MDSRDTDEGLAIRRRRACDRCGFRFSTVESVEILNLTVIKRDGRREPYHREKLERGLKRALEKRPITHEAFQRLIGQVERDIQRRGRTEITSAEIGEIVIKRLQRVDQIAYIRFASVYRQFQDLGSFQAELKKLSTGRPSRRISSKRRLQKKK